MQAIFIVVAVVFATSAQAQPCVIGSIAISPNGSRAFYELPTVQPPKTCRDVEELRACVDGKLTGSAGYTTCRVFPLPAYDCSYAPGMWIKDGQTQVFFSQERSSQCSDVSMRRTCSNGVLSGPAEFKYAQCSSIGDTKQIETQQLPKSCVFDGHTVSHRTTVMAYVQRTVRAPATCADVSSARTCEDGTLSGNTTASYWSCSIQTAAPPTSSAPPSWERVYSDAWFLIANSLPSNIGATIAQSAITFIASVAVLTALIATSFAVRFFLSRAQSPQLSPERQKPKPAPQPQQARRPVPQETVSEPTLEEMVKPEQEPVRPSVKTDRKLGSEFSRQWQQTGLSSLIKLIANSPTFVLLYLLFMVPTYLLPYVGSNSVALNTYGKSAGIGFNPAFWWHLLSLLILCVLAWARGAYVAKTWLIVFPMIALVFDMVPGLNLLPLVPTTMHLCAIIVGVSSKKPPPKR